MNRDSALAEGLAAAGLSAFFFWGLRFLPVVGIVFVPGAALPLVRLGARRGAKSALAAGAGAAALSAAIGFSITRSLPDSAGQALALLATAGACGVAGGLARTRDASRVFLGLAIWGAVLGAGLWSAAPGSDREVQTRFDAMTSASIASLRQSGADPEAMKTWQSTAELVRGVIVRYGPGLIAGLWIAVAAAAFYLGRRFALRGPEGGGFSRLRLPPALAGLFVLAGAAAALFRGDPRRAAVDVLIPVLVLYFLAGLSIIAYFARRWFRTGVLRAAIYVMVWWLPPLWAGTAVLGLFDWYFDLRKRAEKQAIGRNE
ncbi:MAG TPA: DUF2232 domain-containing protein [Thermoanaerobaculia bacterium]|nr:DUF2232 domain-containing protein [Thermoanaerobaculia bacterium]